MAAETELSAPADETRRFGRLLLGAAGLMLALAVGLWATYGGAVFMNVMATAWSYCF